MKTRSVYIFYGNNIFVDIYYVAVLTRLLRGNEYLVERSIMQLVYLSPKIVIVLISLEP